MDLKERVRDFWNTKPCGTLGVVLRNPDLAYFERIRERRYRLEPFVKTYAGFAEARGKEVLEIGCGVGTDGVEFARHGARYTGIDLSPASLDLAKKNFELHGLSGTLLASDSEKLPFGDARFDFVYSWGVLHHTPFPAQAIAEVKRVLKPGGTFCIMLYNRRSLVGLQLWLRYGLLGGRPFVSWRRLFSEHHESPGTQALSGAETRELFRDFSNVTMETVVTPYDLRVSRNVFLPRFFAALAPRGLGFFRVVRGGKQVYRGARIA
jgi:ubiquinone/menaquinone biosynthesis C-methylase UbiE